MSKRKSSIVFETIPNNFSESKSTTPTSNNIRENEGETPHTPKRLRTCTCPDAPKKLKKRVRIARNAESLITRLEVIIENEEREEKNLRTPERPNNPICPDAPKKPAAITSVKNMNILSSISKKLDFSTEDAEKENKNKNIYKQKDTFRFHRFTLKRKTSKQAKKGNIIFSSK